MQALSLSSFSNDVRLNKINAAGRNCAPHSFSDFNLGMSDKTPDTI